MFDPHLVTGFKIFIMGMTPNSSYMFIPISRNIHIYFRFGFGFFANYKLNQSIVDIHIVINHFRGPFTNAILLSCLATLEQYPLVDSDIAYCEMHLSQII